MAWAGDCLWPLEPRDLLGLEPFSDTSLLFHLRRLFLFIEQAESRKAQLLVFKENYSLQQNYR